MKKIVYILVAMTTSFTGLLAYYGNFFIVPISDCKVRQIVPLYELEMNPQLYTSQKVLLQEDLIVHSAFNKEEGSFVYYLRKFIKDNKEVCKSFPDHNDIKKKDCVVIATLKFVHPVQEKEKQIIKEIAEKNAQDNSGRQFYGIKVEVVGTVNTSERLDDYQTLDIFSIKQISPVRVISAEEESNP